MAAIRKRDRYTRGRAKRRRPQTPAPKAGWLIGELAEITQVPVRRLRNYVAQRLLTPSEFRGTSTRYQRRELLRLVALLRIKTESKFTLAQIKARLDALDETEIEARLRKGPLPPSAAAALGIIVSDGASEPSQTPPIEALQPWSQKLETWRRIQLLPGLDLMLDANATPAAMRAAHKIYEEFSR